MPVASVSVRRVLHAVHVNFQRELHCSSVHLASPAFSLLFTSASCLCIHRLHPDGRVERVCQVHGLVDIFDAFVNIGFVGYLMHIHYLHCMYTPGKIRVWGVGVCAGKRFMRMLQVGNRDNVWKIVTDRYVVMTE